MDKIQIKHFFLKMKAGKYSDEIIQKELELSDNEYAEVVKEYSKDIEQAISDRARAKTIGKEMMHLTTLMHQGVSDQMNGVYRPEVVKSMEGEIIDLPNPKELSFPEKNLRDIIEQRTSVRTYSQENISLEELSYLLWLTQGVRKIRENDKVAVTLRNVPTAGARNPLETYLFVNRVDTLKQGLYFYDARDHKLVLMNDDDKLQEKIWQACCRQDMVKNCAVNFIWSAIPYRTAWRYQSRSYRYMHLDVGHVCQNLYLVAESLDCGVCAIGAYYDEFIDTYLNLDGVEETVIYIATLGKKELS